MMSTLGPQAGAWRSPPGWRERRARRRAPIPGQAEIDPVGGWTGEVRQRRSSGRALRHALSRGGERVAVQLAVRRGVRDPNRLANLIFLGRHPDRRAKPIRPGERPLVREWQDIRRYVVEPVLAEPEPASATTSTAPVAGRFSPVSVENPGGGRIQDKRDPAPADLSTVTGAGGKRVPLHRLAAAAWSALLAEARAAGVAKHLLLPVSGYRNSTRQARLFEAAVKRYGSRQAASRWVAPPGGSAHQSGRAIDFYLGSRNDSANVERLRELPAHQWLAANARRFGFYPYEREPWHWEYNPPAQAQRELLTELEPEVEEAPPGEAEFAEEWLGESAAPRAAISPLAVSAGALRTGRRRPAGVQVAGVCVHTTSGGPARRARERGGSALRIARDYYLRGGEGFPHYLIDRDGTIYVICVENQVAAHAGWKSVRGRAGWSSWTAPDWWRRVWSRWNVRTPSDLVPQQAGSPNDIFVGVELLADETGYGFTPGQYGALARLVLDVSRRHGFTIAAAPSPRLLGHEDVNPTERSNAGGGWDPGAHRENSKFSWDTLWRTMRQESGLVGLGRTLLAPALTVAGAVAGALSGFGGRTASPPELARAIVTGERDPSSLANLVFFARHPERGGRRIAQEERAAVQEWLDIRDRLVIPALRAATGGAAGRPTRR